VRHDHLIPQEPAVNEHRFDTVTRTAADTASRRASFLAFGGAALAAALASAPAADARGDKGTKQLKKKLKKVKKEFARACAAQAGQCQAVMNALCATTMNPGQCLQIVSPCCALVTDCDVGPGLTCLFSL
jgi:hypothetical protein